MAGGSRSDDHDDKDGEYDGDDRKQDDHGRDEVICVAESFGFVESFMFSVSAYSCSTGREARVPQNKFSHDSGVGWQQCIQNTLKYV
jgi:hypothetical protein